MSWLGFGEYKKEDVKKKTLLIELSGGKNIICRPDSDIFCVICCGKQ